MFTHTYLTAELPQLPEDVPLLTVLTVRSTHVAAPARFARDIKFFLLSLTRSMERKKRTCFTASAIARSHTSRILPVVPSDGHTGSLLGKSNGKGEL
jgi:hypothetical protein